MNAEATTTISVSRELKERLAKMFQPREDWEDLLTRIAIMAEEHQREKNRN